MEKMEKKYVLDTTDTILICVQYSAIPAEKARPGMLNSYCRS